MIEQCKAQGIITSLYELTETVGEDLWDIRVHSTKWTLKEIIGHLVDSASNNHQRFVRLQFSDLETLDPYEAEPWVAIQRYADFETNRLVQLWHSFNELLLHFAFSSRAVALGHVWKTKDGPKRLDFLITDYYDHMQGHIDHFRKRRTEVLEFIAK